MARPVGYLLKMKDGLAGERGEYYDYIVAGNGVFVETEGPLFAARVPVCGCEIRGLSPVEPELVLRHGKIPQRLFDLALNAMLGKQVQIGDIALVKTPFGNTFYVPSEEESYIAVTWEGEYRLRVPEQEGTSARVMYEVLNNVILDMHSHGRMGAFFSPQDNRDEQGLKLYAVIGKLPDAPRLLLRVGIYGYHYPISWGAIFEGTLQGVTEETEDNLDEAEFVKEVKEHVHGDTEASAGNLPDRGSRMWWNRWLRGRRHLPFAPEQ